jgi:hypothetical protein
MAIQFHHAEWQKFANEQKLNMKRVPDISSLEYEYATTRLARAAWDRRSVLAATQETTSHYNHGIQDASELVYELCGETVAKAIQGLRK